MAAQQFGNRVRFRDTGAVGTSHATVDQLNPYDGGAGPWHHVDFDDGLQCWVTASSLQILTVLGWV